MYFFLYYKIVKCIVSFCLFLALHLHYLHKRYHEVHGNGPSNRKKDVLGLTLQLNLEERVICYGRSSYSQELFTNKKDIALHLKRKSANLTPKKTKKKSIRSNDTLIFLITLF